MLGALAQMLESGTFTVGAVVSSGAIVTVRVFGTPASGLTGSSLGGGREGGTLKGGILVGA